jgi:hypothetical protein
MIPGWLIYEIWYWGYFATSLILMFKVFVPDFQKGILKSPLKEFIIFLMLNVFWPIWLIIVFSKSKK